jgi:hypothetical protein
MIVKSNLKKLKKVRVSVWVDATNRFRDGRYSKTFTVYDALPEQVLNVLEKAFEKE